MLLLGRAELTPKAKSCQSRKVSVFGCDLADLLRIDQGAHYIRVGLYLQCIRGDCDCLLDAAYGKGDISAQGLRDVYDQTLLQVCSEAAGRSGKVICANVKAWENIDSVGIGICVELSTGGCLRLM